jgi:hypothetical protein
MDATAGAPAYSAKNARQAQAALYGNPTGRVFGTRSGWRVGTLSSIVSVTSTTWTLNPCACMIEPAASLYQGCYGWASDDVINGPMTAADGTNPRIDILYIQVNDSSAGDGSGGLSAPVSYLAGTPAPAGTQVAPPLPPRSFLVATIAVPKLAAGSPTVTFNQTYFVAAGGVLPVMSATDFATLVPYPGMAVCRRDLPHAPIWTYDGAAWNGDGAAVPLILPGGYVAKGSGFATPSVYRSGGRNWLMGAISTNVASLNITAGSTYIAATLPAGFAPAAGAAVNIPCMVRTSTTNVIAGWVQVDSTNNISYTLATGISALGPNLLFFGLDHISWPAA